MSVPIVPTPKPYRARPYFPNVRNPLVQNVKLDYFTLLKPVINDLLLKHKSEFDDIFDVNAFIRQQAETSDPEFTFLVAALGVYSSAILREYGTAIFDRRSQADVIEDLQARLDSVTERPSTVAREPDPEWSELLDKYELALAKAIREADGPE